MRSRSGTGEPEVVRAGDLGRILRSAMYRYNALHPEQSPTQPRGKVRRKGQLSFQSYLSHRCIITDPQHLGLHERRVHMLIKGTEQQYVGLWTADLVLTALGLNGLLGTDELQVMKNPRWSQESYDRYMDAATSEMIAPSPRGEVSGQRRGSARS